MKEEYILGLEGDMLRNTFLKAAFPLIINEEPGPLASVLNSGQAVVFNDAIEFKVMSIFEQQVTALLFLQKHNPSFEVTENGKGVYCTVRGAQAHGCDFFEAGMRAYLLYLARQRKH
ncbi:hypothetical protein GTP46_11220 [Duganella sp. FT135W]|uniref:Uncharacterized protein n=1 Tax=Duganella flavida TaxID=2692175 RepID=A0A6L8K763_9BURK|nr:hypothetical protein [Duganella flavida]MYM23216.1 hypothetical protein [Duganella flavida]